jgi:hypothetical protein
MSSPKKRICRELKFAEVWSGVFEKSLTNLARGHHLPAKVGATAVKANPFAHASKVEMHRIIVRRKPQFWIDSSSNYSLRGNNRPASRSDGVV